jgi:hypothetical protein
MPPPARVDFVPVELTEIQWKAEVEVEPDSCSWRIDRTRSDERAAHLVNRLNQYFIRCPKSNSRAKQIKIVIKHWASPTAGWTRRARRVIVPAES